MGAKSHTNQGTSDSGSTSDQSAPITPSHQYIMPGDYTVEACFTDKDGETGCDTQVVTVLGPVDLKQDTIADLSPHQGESKRFEKAIKEIEKSLGAKLWVDEILLDDKHGKKVFDHEKHAVKELVHLLKGHLSEKCGGVSRIVLEYTGAGTVDIEVWLKKDLLATFSDVDTGDLIEVLATGDTGGKLHPEITLVVGGVEGAKIHTSCSKPVNVGDVNGDFVIADLDTLPGKGKKGQLSPGATDSATDAISDLVHADRLLARIALDVAGSATVVDPKHQGKVDKELAKAQDELAKGESERDAGKPDKAIDHYKKAWEHAMHALKEAAHEEKAAKPKPAPKPKKGK